MISVLSCRGLTKQYRKNGPAVLSNLNLDIPRGQIVGLLGPNGSGKTTLLKLTSGLLTPTSGEILVTNSPPSPLTKARVSYMPDRDYLPNWMRAGDLIDYFKDFYADFQYNKALDMLHSLGLVRNMPLKTMSKGMREKMQLVLTMSRQAELYLLDEPIGGVDPAARDFILNTIITNYSENSTVIISTHLISDIERVLDSVVFLAGGAVYLHGAADQVREAHGMSIDALFREVYKC